MPDTLFQRRIQKGDTLSAIAEEVLGSASRWKEIYEINRDTIGANPSQIKPGQNIRLPGQTSEPGVEPLPGPIEAPTPAVATDKHNWLNNVKGPPTVEKLEAGSAFMEGMLRRGWSIEEAAAAAGNAHVESGFRPGVKSSVKNEQSYGFLQWNKERLAGLQNMAADSQRDWTDPEVQMDWINMERTGESVNFGGSNEQAMYAKAFQGGGSPEEMAERFGQFVERPKKLSDTAAIRRAAAAKYAYLDDVTDRLSGG